MQFLPEIIVMSEKARDVSSGRKAISPFIAVVILVVITVGLSMFVGSWLRNYALTQTKETESSTTNVIYCSNKLIKISGVFWQGDRLVVRVENPGAEPIKVTRVFAFNKSFSGCDVYSGGDGVEFGSNEVRDFTATCPAGFGSVYKVRVTTECANVYDVWMNESA